MKIGLVLEGGANRGVFTSGVLDYFMEQDLGKAFRYVIGTSAGAGNAMNFISGQHGRSRDTTITKDKRYAYFGLKNIIRTGHLFDMENIYWRVPTEYNLFDFDVRAVDGRDVYFRAKRRLRIGQRNFNYDVVAVTLKHLVGKHGNAHLEIAAGAAVSACVALAGKSDGLTVCDTSRDIYRDLDLLLCHAVAGAGRARSVDDLALAAALRADPCRLHRAEHGLLAYIYLTGTVAVRAGLCLGARLCAGAVAVRAGLNAVDLNVADYALAGLHELDIKRYDDIRASARRVRIGARTSAEAAAENVVEYIAEVYAVAAAESACESAETAESSTAACALTRAVARIDSREAELIVSGLLLRVGKHIVSFVDLLEFSLCLGIIRIKVGVVFLCHLTVRLLDLSVGSALFQTQHLVIVFFIHK